MCALPKGQYHSASGGGEGERADGDDLYEVREISSPEALSGKGCQRKYGPISILDRFHEGQRREGACWIFLGSGMMDKYLIWSWEHFMWWKSNREGYTPHVGLAGIYSPKDAGDIVVHHIPPGGLVAVDIIFASRHGEPPAFRRPKAWEREE
jgi:hypothetical protein